MKMTIMHGLVWILLCVATGTVTAQVTDPVTIDFEQPGQSAYTGWANTMPNGSGSATCQTIGASGCYLENGMAVGVVYDPNDFANHFHRKSASQVALDGGGDGTGYSASQMGFYALGTYSDASGIYIRATDSTAFSVTSMIFNASYTPSNVGINPVYGDDPYVDGNGILEPQGSYVDLSTGNLVLDSNVAPSTTDEWEILGFSNAYNPTLAQDTQGSYTAIDSQTGEPVTNLYPEVGGNGPVYSDLVAEQFVPNGFNGVLQLNSGFQNVSAIWIFKEGYPETPTNGISFRAYIDDIQVNEAVVPLPSTILPFSAGLGLLLGLRRKNSPKSMCTDSCAASSGLDVLNCKGRMNL